MVAVKAHAELGASTSDRWMNCSGSPREIAKVPMHLRPKSSIHAAEGTAAHALLEGCLGAKKKARVFLGFTIIVDELGETTFAAPEADIDHEIVDGYVFIVDRAMCEHVQVCLDHVKEEVRRLEKKYGLPVDIGIEERVYPLEEEPDMYGTADVILSVKGKEIVVIDFKYGAGIIVDVDGNTQMLYYGLGGARKGKFRFKKVKMTIVQPRAHHEDGVIRSDTISMDEMQAWADVLRAAMKRTMKKGAALEAGEWCRFCDAAATCPELSKKVSNDAGADFDEEPEAIEVPTAVKEINRRLQWLPMLRAYVKQLEAFGHRVKASDPKALPDFKFVRGRSNRKYRPDVKEGRIVKWLVKRGVEPDDIYTDPELKTPAQLEKLISKKKRGIFNDKFITRPDGKISLVPVSDKREAVSVKPSDDFDDLEE